MRSPGPVLLVLGLDVVLKPEVMGHKVRENPSADTTFTHVHTPLLDYTAALLSLFVFSWKCSSSSPIVTTLTAQ